MRYGETLTFCGQTYRREGGTFKVPLAAAKGLRMGNIPGHSTLELTDLPTVPTGYELFIMSTNAEDDGCFSDLNINAGIGLTVDEHVQRKISRVKRLYEPCVAAGELPESTVFRNEYGDWKMASVGWSLTYPNQPEVLVTDAISPILERFVELSSPDIHLFLCHAGEDKPFVERLAEFLQDSGASVWFDQWEIRVGDSIVVEFSDGNQMVHQTH